MKYPPPLCSSQEHAKQDKTLSNIEIQFNEFKYINCIASLHLQHIIHKYRSQYKYPRITDDLIVIILQRITNSAIVVKIYKI